MPAIPEDYVPTPSTPDHWVPMSTRIQERRDRAEDARGGKGKGKEKTDGQRAKHRPEEAHTHIHTHTHTGKTIFSTGS